MAALFKIGRIHQNYYCWNSVKGYCGKGYYGNGYYGNGCYGNGSYGYFLEYILYIQYPKIAKQQNLKPKQRLNIF